MDVAPSKKVEKVEEEEEDQRGPGTVLVMKFVPIISRCLSCFCQYIFCLISNYLCVCTLYFVQSYLTVCPCFAAPVGNGGCTDKYWWTQTLSEVNVMLKLPAGTRGRDVSVQIMTDRLHVQIKGEATPTIDVKRLVA